MQYTFRRSKRHGFLLKQCTGLSKRPTEHVLVQKGKSAIIISRKCFKGFIHSTFRCESPLYMKDFRSGKSFTTIQSRKINFNLRFSQSLVEIHYWNLYSKKIIVLDFHLEVRTVKFFFASDRVLIRYHYSFFKLLMRWIRCFLRFT